MVAVLAPVAALVLLLVDFATGAAGRKRCNSVAGAQLHLAGNLGIGLVFYGIAQSISPQPKPDRTIDESVQLESFSFSNVVNTSKQGLPVPIAYGRPVRWIGNYF